MTDSVREIAIIIGLGVVAVVLGLATGELGWSLWFATLIWLALQVMEYRKISRWAKRPYQQPQNASEGWFRLAYQPFRLLIRERARTRAMVRRLRDILSLTEVIPDAVIILSIHGEIEGMNNAAKTLLNLSDQDIGLGLSTVVRNPDFIHFIRTGKSDQSLEFVSAQDPERSYEARRIDSEGGRIIMLVRDITALNRVLTMRQSFVANVSHELRTPLTVVSGYLETILDTEQDADVRLQLTARLDSPIKRLQSLVSDLMLLSQLESTSSEDSKTRVRLGPVVKAAVHEIQPLCSRPDQIHFELESDLEILGIESELYSLCINLLSNALRYSPEGNPIEVSLKPYKDRLRLTVTDHGFGIAPVHLNRLTERFYRVDLAGSRTRGGTGLGLAIVKHVLLRHDSTLQIRSALGQGSSFICDFQPTEKNPDHLP